MLILSGPFGNVKMRDTRAKPSERGGKNNRAAQQLLVIFIRRGRAASKLNEVSSEAAQRTASNEGQLVLVVGVLVGVEVASRGRNEMYARPPTAASAPASRPRSFDRVVRRVSKCGCLAQIKWQSCRLVHLKALAYPIYFCQG